MAGSIDTRLNPNLGLGLTLGAGPTGAPGTADAPTAPGQPPGALAGDTATGLNGTPLLQSALSLDSLGPWGEIPVGIGTQGPPSDAPPETLRPFGEIDVALEVPDRPDDPQPSRPPSDPPPTEPAPPVPPPLPEEKAKGLTFRSWGDPHEVTGDGLRFDNQLVGDFVAMRSRSGDLEVQKRHEHVGAQSSGVTFNTAATIKTNGDVVGFHSQTDVLTLNGQAVGLADGQTIQLPSGGSVTRNGNSYTIRSAQGDRFTFIDQGKYMDIEGELATTRRDGEVLGALGAFDADADASNDLVLPDGTPAKNVQEFIEAWRVSGGDRLIPGTAAGDTHATGSTKSALRAGRSLSDSLAALREAEERRRRAEDEERERLRERLRQSQRA